MNYGIDEWGTVWVEGYDMGNIFVTRDLTIELAVSAYLKGLSDHEVVIPSTYLNIAL